MPDQDSAAQSPKNQWFPPTHWTQVMAARQKGSAEASQALEHLCGVYWYPVYAYIRRKGYAEADAKDMAQGFFHHILERNLLGAVDRSKGKFRSFLLGSLNYFMANRRDFERAKKRGGGATIISLDDKEPEGQYALEPKDDLSPERLFDRRWALHLLGQARTHLRREYGRQGKEMLFENLKVFLEGETESGDYPSVALELGMTAGAVTTAVHRLRQRYGELIEEEIARTVASREEIPAERQYIYEVLSKP